MEKIKSAFVLALFVVAVIATIVCPFTAVTAAMVGKLWLTYMAVQLVLAILDGSLAEWICFMMSLRNQ